MPEAWFNLSIALRGLGRLAGALESLKNADFLTRTQPEAQNSIGLEFFQLNALAEARTCFEQAIALAPGYALPYSNLGQLFERLGRPEEAEAAFVQAIALQPDLAPVYVNLCGILNAQRKFESAERAGRKAIELDPESSVAWSNLGCSLIGRGDFTAAEEACRKAIKCNPASPEGWSNLGGALASLKRFDLADVACRKAIEFGPTLPEAWCTLGWVLAERFRLDEAEEACRKAIELDQALAMPYSILGRCCFDKGLFGQAFDQFRVAAHKAQFDPGIITNALFCLNYLPEEAPGEMLVLARQFDKAVHRNAVPYVEWNCLVGKRLRVGFVSGDFRQHSVGYFLKDVLVELGRLDVDIFAYSNTFAEDDLTAELRQSCRGWRSIAGVGDGEVARQIREDGIHVLVDLSGHTELSRLPVFAWRPAPVQASWLGYCATTGVTEMDYYIADAETLPAELEPSFTEKIWRLPTSYLCFSRPQEDVAVSATPALGNGYVTFGSFNNLTKMSDEVVRLWSRLLLAVPGSRLLLKSKQLAEPSIRQRVLEQYQGCGIAAERLILEGYLAERGGHLSAYSRVDIGLDPFPYNGVTTTMEALWMGVPVLSLTGERFLARQGVGILRNVGLADWIAQNGDDLLAKAAGRAGDVEGLQELRASLRGRLQASPLLDAPRFAGHFADALRGMWNNRHCGAELG